MADQIKIASNDDVLDSISRRVKTSDEIREYNYYHIVSVENHDGVIGELEDLPKTFGSPIVDLIIFSNFAETRMYAYIKTRSAMSPWSVLARFEELGFDKIRVRIRRFGVKNLLFKSALRGGFMFGEYAFPLRPIYREVELKNREFHLEKGVEYVQVKQPAYVKELQTEARMTPIRRVVKK